MRLLTAVMTLLMTTATALVAGDGKPSTSDAEAALKRLSWLIGTWKSATSEGATGFEVWRAETPQLFVGTGYTMKGTDTTWSEKLRIEATESGLFYVADVAHNAAPVRFKMTRQDSTTTVFENPKHDFPTRIIYKRLADGSLHARIEGVRKGKETGVDFVFSQVK